MILFICYLFILTLVECQQHEEYFEEQQLCLSTSEQLDLDLRRQSNRYFKPRQQKNTEEIHDKT